MITVEKLLEATGYSGLLLEVSIDELRRQFVDSEPQKLTPEVFDQIVQASNNKSNFATWLCKKVNDKVIPENEIAGWREVFEFFERYKSRFEKKDINQIKTAEDIAAFKQDYERVKTDVEAKKVGGGKTEELEPCQLGNIRTSDGKNWKVFKVGQGQWELERKIGSGTEWCTVANSGYFNQYLRQGGHYYIFINRDDPKEKYQFHHESNQFMDKKDHVVNYKLPFIQDFFEYLRIKENKPLPRQVEEAKKEIEEDKAIIQFVENNPVPEGLAEVKDFEEGRVLISTSSPMDMELKNTAFFFKEASVSLSPVVLDTIRMLCRRSSNSRIGAIVFKNKESDILYCAGEWLTSLSPETEDADNNLPKADEDNIDIYRYVSNRLECRLSDNVVARCDRNLPNLKDYFTKESAGTKYYVIPQNIVREQKDAKIKLQIAAEAKRSTGYYDRFPNGSDVLVAIGEFKGNDTAWIFNRSLSWVSGPIYSQEPEILDKTVKILKDGFDIDIASTSRDVINNNLHKTRAWAQAGGTKGIEEELKKTVNVEGLDPQKISVVKSEKISNVLSAYWNTPRPDAYSVLYKPGDTKHLLYYNTYNKRIGNINDTCTAVERSYETMGQFRTSPIEPAELAKVYVAFGGDIPGALEKLLSRMRTGTAPANILKVMRDNANNFEEYVVPVLRRRSGNETVYRIRGLYGTWDTLKDAMKESSATAANNIQTVLNDIPNGKADLFLYYHYENPRHSWNCLVRFMNEDGKIVKYGRRTGNRDGCVWSFTEVHPDEQIEAREFNSTVVMPQPRQARGRRNAQQQQQANAPAVDLGAVAQNLNRFADQSQYADTIYNIPGDRAEIQEVLGGLGAPVIESLPQNVTRVILYQLRARRGEGGTTLGLIIVTPTSIVISGQPTNYNYTTCLNHNASWRGLIYELTNSVPRFQQACDICEEKHITLPAGLEAWPNRRQ